MKGRLTSSCGDRCQHASRHEASQRISGLSRQNGQALTEFIVISFVMIPIFLLMPLIGKYQDIAHATQMASRYVAFEAMTFNDATTAYKPADQLAGEVRRRFFSNSDAPIKTNDTAGNFRSHQNLFWRGPSGNSLIENFDTDVTVSFGQSRSPDHASGFSTASDGSPFNNFPVNVADAMDLRAQGIYTANITVAVANIDSPPNSFAGSFNEFRNIGLRITRHTSVAIDPWAAANPQQVESRIDRPIIAPGNLLAPIKPVTDLAVALVESPTCFSRCLPGPQLGQLDIWRDVVPADRLQ